MGGSLDTKAKCYKSLGPPVEADSLHEQFEFLCDINRHSAVLGFLAEEAGEHL